MKPGQYPTSYLHSRALQVFIALDMCCCTCTVWHSLPMFWASPSEVAVLLLLAFVNMVQCLCTVLLMRK